MSNPIPITFRVPDKTLKSFDKQLKGRSRTVVLRKLMEMYSNGYIDIDWDYDYSQQIINK
jgi:hypothetical protein